MTRAMKDSGIEWIGNIPKKWEVTRLKQVCNITMGQSPDSDDYNTDGIGVPFLQGNTDFTNKFPIERIYCNNANKFSKILDILFSVRAPVGAKNFSDKVYAIGRGLCAITPKKLNKNLLWYLIDIINQEFNFNVKGSTYDSVTIVDVKNAKIPQPSFREQEVIANYLDSKCNIIDSAIEKQKSVIEKLKSYKQSLITETVTKGLEPTVKMKPSGIEWIGGIPEGWEVKPIFVVFKERKSRNIGNAESNLLSLSYGNIIRKDISDNMGLLPESFEGYNIIEKDNIVFRLTDLQNDHVSLRSAIALEKGIITSAYVTLESIIKICARFY